MKQYDDALEEITVMREAMNIRKNLVKMSQQPSIY